MVKIRLKRMGAHKKPFYRVVVADSRSARNGRFIEEVGYYNPLTEPPTIKIDGEKAQKWLDNGAQPTDVVRDLLKRSGVLGEAKAKAAKEAQAEVVEEAAEVVEEAAEVAEEATEKAEEAADAE